MPGSFRLASPEEDLFADSAKGDILVNPVNCVGVMGGGLALAFSRRYPEILAPYKKVCNKGDLRPGVVMRIPVESRVIYLFPTKDDWRHPSEMRYITEGLVGLIRGLKSADAQAQQTKTAHIPALGCGLGGLSWDDVLPVIANMTLPVRDTFHFVVYPPR